MVGRASQNAARLEKFGDRIRFLGKTPDEAQLRKLMKRSDPRIYTGTFVTCSDNPDRRLCRPPADSAQAPALNSCQPLACNNAAFTEDNRAAWRHRLALLDVQLARGEAFADQVALQAELRQTDADDDGPDQAVADEIDSFAEDATEDCEADLCLGRVA